MMTAESPTEAITWAHHKRHVFTVGDTVTVEGSPGVWRIAGFFGRSDRMQGSFEKPQLIADLVRLDKKWTAATSAYVSSLRAVA